MNYFTIIMKIIFTNKHRCSNSTCLCCISFSQSYFFQKIFHQYSLVMMVIQHLLMLNIKTIISKICSSFGIFNDTYKLCSIPLSWIFLSPFCSSTSGNILDIKRHIYSIPFFFSHLLLIRYLYFRLNKDASLIVLKWYMCTLVDFLFLPISWYL